MRVVMQALGSAGDVHPYVGLGRELHARGHEVIVVTGESFGGVVEKAGLAFRQLGTTEAYEQTMADPDLWHPRRGLTVVTRDAIAPSLEPGFELISELIEPGRTVVLASTLGFAAQIAAEHAKVPLVKADLAPANYVSVHRPPRYAGLPLPPWLPAFVKRGALGLAMGVADRVVRPPINAFRSSIGMDPVRRVFTDWALRADLLLGMFPAWFGPPQPDWPANLQLVGFPLFDEGAIAPLDDQLVAWLDEGTAPIVFTAGSANVFGKAFYRAGVEAAARLDRRAILVTRNADIVPKPLPPHARHVSYAPFSRLFRRAAAVVHHGGIGTSAQTCAAGVPSVVAAMGFDQFDNASRLVDLGVGRMVPMRRFRTAKAVAALRTVLADEVRDRARRLPQEHACGFEADRTCQLIAELV